MNPRPQPQGQGENHGEEEGQGEEHQGVGQALGQNGVDALAAGVGVTQPPGGHLPEPVAVADEHRLVQPQIFIDALPLRRGEPVHLAAVDGGGRVPRRRVDQGEGEAAHEQQDENAL